MLYFLWSFLVWVSTSLIFLAVLYPICFKLCMYSLSLSHTDLHSIPFSPLVLYSVSLPPSILYSVSFSPSGQYSIFFSPKFYILDLSLRPFCLLYIYLLVLSSVFFIFLYLSSLFFTPLICVLHSVDNSPYSFVFYFLYPVSCWALSQTILGLSSRSKFSVCI